MLIAGDIGSTTIRLALVSPQGGPRRFVAEQEFHSSDHKALREIVEAFLAKTAGHSTFTYFCVARPVLAGRAHVTDLPWELEETVRCNALELQRVRLLNDQQAIAHAVPHLLPEETAVIN